MRDDLSQCGFQCDHSKRGRIDLKHFFLERTRPMSTADDVDRAVAQTLYTSIHMLLRSQRRTDFAVGIKRPKHRIIHVHICNINSSGEMNTARFGSPTKLNASRCTDARQMQSSTGGFHQTQISRCCQVFCFGRNWREPQNQLFEPFVHHSTFGKRRYFGMIEYDSVEHPAIL